MLGVKSFGAPMGSRFGAFGLRLSGFRSSWLRVHACMHACMYMYVCINKYRHIYIYIYMRDSFRVYLTPASSCSIYK